MEEDRSVFKILIGIPTGKTAVGRPISIWEDIIRMNLQEISFNIINWIDSAQDKEY